jgi:hypothetical protein
VIVRIVVQSKVPFSTYYNSVQKVDIYLDDEKKQSQHISHCLWNLYRGTGFFVTPYFFQSIHMALEKYFLRVGEKIESNILEDWLLYILKNSESASISSVVASIVLAVSFLLPSHQFFRF